MFIPKYTFLEGYAKTPNLGWSLFMTNLKALLEYGVDLRETDPDRAYASQTISH